MQYLGAISKTKIISVHFQCKPFYITVNQVYAPSTATKEAEQFFEGLKDLLGLTPKNKSFSSQRTGIQSRKSRDTWSSSQVGPRNPKLSRSKTNRLLPREHTGHNKHPLPTSQETTLHMDITRWERWRSSLQPKTEKLYTVSKNKTRSWLWLRSWTPYCQIQTEIEESRENHQTIQVWPKSNPLWLYSGSDK